MPIISVTAQNTLLAGTLVVASQDFTSVDYTAYFVRNKQQLKCMFMFLFEILFELSPVPYRFVRDPGANVVSVI